MNTLDKNEYLNEVSKLLKVVSDEKHIMFDYPPFVESASMDREEQEKEKLHFNKLYRRKLLKFLQKNAEYALVYGIQYDEASYCGEAKIINSHIQTKNRKKYLNLQADLWSQCTNFWVCNDGNDKEVLYNAFGSADFYFFVNPKKCDWKEFFSFIHLPSCWCHLQSYLNSRAGYKVAYNTIEKHDDMIVFEFFTHTIMASQENLQRLVLLSHAYSDMSNYGLNIQEDPIEAIFLTEENAKNALDFSKGYHSFLDGSHI